jgi:hypothetical protein
MLEGIFPVGLTSPFNSQSCHPSPQAEDLFFGYGSSGRKNVFAIHPQHHLLMLLEPEPLIHRPAKHRPEDINCEAGQMDLYP